MIDFSIPEDTRLLVDTVRRFVETEVQPLEDEVERTATVPADKLAVTKAKAQKLGLYAMNMPADVGGGGLSCIEHCLVEEEFGKTSDALIRRVFGQVYPMLMACKGDQVERYLLPTVKGDKICAMAITEPGAGSDAASISTTAHLDGDEWVLNGTKHFISDGDIADYVILMALTDKDKRARGGITLFLVDRGTPGFKVARTQPMMGHRGYGHAELSFEDCRIPKRRRARRGRRRLQADHAERAPDPARPYRRARRRHGAARARNDAQATPASGASSASRSATSRWCRS